MEPLRLERVGSAGGLGLAVAEWKQRGPEERHPCCPCCPCEAAGRQAACYQCCRRN